MKGRGKTSSSTTTRHVEAMNRRQAIGAAGGALGLLAMGGRLRADAPQKTGLGVVIYALGHRRAAMKAENPQIDLFEPLAFLDYCHGLGAGGVQVPLGVREAQYAGRLRERAEQFGMFVEGIAGPPQRDADVERFDAEMRTAAAAGARVVRMVIMPGRRYEQFRSLAEFRQAAERGRQALERAAPIAERRGVRLAVENHKDQRIDERLRLLEHVGSEYVGACVDTGNSISLLEDPLAVVEAFAPWALSVHLKDQAVAECDDGFLLADAALGEGTLGLKRMVDVLRRAKPDVRFGLETITRDALRVPCLSDAYWVTFPDVPGRDLARTLRMVRANAAGELPRIGSLSPDQQATAELAVVKRSLAYARDELGL